MKVRQLVYRLLDMSQDRQVMLYINGREHSVTNVVTRRVGGGTEDIVVFVECEAAQASEFSEVDHGL